MNDKYVYIIGAGISGLVAAFELEKSGFAPVILEASDTVGGRVKTDRIDGYRLDRGFQVLFTAYPEARKYLDFKALSLKYFDPGAIILKPGNTFVISDPIRQPTRFLNMAFSQVGGILDKIRVYQLNKELKMKTEEEIFAAPSTTTMAYLKKRGFSNRIIGNFFRPFFEGIFLEEGLATSSRMFEFVFKMLSIGHAAIPELGMQEIPNQLLSRLKNTQIRYNTRVKGIDGKKIILDDGEEISADAIILATDSGNLALKHEQHKVEYHSVTNIYYTLQNSFLAQAKIALIPDEKFWVNNLVFLTDISPAYAPDGRALLSVSIIKDVSKESNLEKKVAVELEAISGVDAGFFKPLHTYVIESAIPKMNEVRYNLPSVQIKWYDGVYLAGDHLLNGSINAAMTSGRRAADTLLRDFQISNKIG